MCCPHYEERICDFDSEFLSSGAQLAWAIEGDSAILFKNGQFVKSLSSGGNSYKLLANGGKIDKIKL